MEDVKIPNIRLEPKSIGLYDWQAGEENTDLTQLAYILRGKIMGLDGIRRCHERNWLWIVLKANPYKFTKELLR